MSKCEKPGVSEDTPDPAFKNTRGPRKIKDHVVLSKEYRRVYFEFLETPFSVDGVSLDGMCLSCPPLSPAPCALYSKTRRMAVCMGCSAKGLGDELVPLEDAPDDMGDLTESVPVIRDSEHNLILQSTKSDRIGLSSIDRFGQVSYISVDETLDSVLDAIDGASDSCWSSDTFYNLPIRAYMATKASYVFLD